MTTGSSGSNGHREELQELLSTLASLSLDVDPHLCASTLDHVHEAFLEHDSDDDHDDNEEEKQQQEEEEEGVWKNQEILGELCSEKLPPLKSKHAKQRVTKLLSNVLRYRILHERDSTGDGSDGGGDAGGDVTVERIVGALCGILIKAKIGLLDKTIAALLDSESIDADNDGNGNDNDDHRSDDDDDDDDDDDHAVNLKLQAAFQKHLNGHSNHWPVALSIIASFSKSSASDSQQSSSQSESSQANLQLFVQQTLQASKSFPPASTIALAQHYLASLSSSSSSPSSPSPDDVVSTLAPIIGLKLRANPETSLETIHAIISYLPTSTLDFSHHLTADKDKDKDNKSSSAKILPSILKQLTHGKVQMRSYASSLLGNLGLFQNCMIDLATELARALEKQSPHVTLTTAEHRMGVYNALSTLAKYHPCNDIDQEDGSGNGNDNDNGDGEVGYGIVVNHVLDAVATCMKKEMGKAKECGLECMLHWMTLSKTSGYGMVGVGLGSDVDGDGDGGGDGGGEDSAAVGKKSKGYSRAMEFFMKPILDVKPGSASIGSEFRLRLGALFTLHHKSKSKLKSSTDAQPQPQSKQQQDQKDGFAMSESFIVDLWEEGRDQYQNLKAGFTSIIEACIKKSKNSNLVAQVDGLMAISCLLTLAKMKKHNSGKDHTILTVLPSCALQVLQDGTNLLSDGDRSAKNSSFLYSQAMMDAFSTDPIVQQLLHRVIATYTKLIAKARDKNDVPASSSASVATTTKGDYVGIVRFQKGMYSAASLALASCIVQSTTTTTTTSADAATDTDGDGDAYASTIAKAVESSVKTVILYSVPVDKATDSIISATYIRANEICADEGGEEKVNGALIRSVASHIAMVATDAERWTNALILSHFGTDADATTAADAAAATDKEYEDEEVEEDEDEEDDDELRMELEERCTGVLQSTHNHVSDPDYESIANHILTSATHSRLNGRNDDEEGILISPAIHQSALSLVKTLGKIAGTYDEEFADEGDEDGSSQAPMLSWKICVKEIAGKLATHLNSVVDKLETFTEEDIGLYNSPEGVLYDNGSKSQKDSNAASNKGKRGSEEEEWERQVRMELEEKKKKQKNAGDVPTLTSEDKSKIAEQTLARNAIRYVLDWEFMRSLAMVQVLSSSDIEVGNAILSTVAPSVVSAAISTSVALNLGSKLEESKKTITKLAECVYEIDEENAEALARALIVCQKRKPKPDSSCSGCGSKNEPREHVVVALPAKCDDAAVAVSEMDDYGDALSGNSFTFLFPVIRAALTGQRTPPGCEAALSVLDRHTELISSHTVVASLRKEMCSSVLELLSHDRSIAFKDPSPTEALINIYTNGKKPTATELAPLLAESGALGGKNCRLATMTTFVAIIEKYPKIVKTNPVMENRILVNCFAKDEVIKAEARRAWKVAHGKSVDETELPAPSKIYAIALVPLLSHKDNDIANAAAAAFAFGIERHPDLTEKSFYRLFNSYIDSYATACGDMGSQSVAPSTSVSATKAPATLEVKPKKKAPKLDIGTVKKKPVKKKTGSSAMASLTKTKATKKKTSKTSTIASFAPKKKERTLDQAELNAQFAPAASMAQKVEEKDSEEKISNRSGVLRVLNALSSSSPAVKLNIPMLKLLVGFLMAYGLADIDEKVRSYASGALRDAVASDSAKNAMEFILPALESTLKDGKANKSFLGELPVDKVLDTTVATDHRKEGVVIALGSAAIHLRNEEDAEKISETFNMLITALSTPSESVQASVALCLSKLMKKGDMKAKTESLLESQINECLHGKSLAQRRGAAYGISAIVKGSGIAALKKFLVVKQLEEACTSGSASTKEGALFAIELLSERLGLLFEPYVIVLLPALLKSFSDSSDHVRSAARNSVGLVMSKLSGHGVKLLVPAVLSGLEEDDWRTKQASIHMLGSMSQCAPKQLASCLPSIVPKVTDAFSDTHPKVKASAASSLEEISKVIRNPEISEISSTLLQALTDPSNGTIVALESLIETEFLHAIDAASLSLIVPVIHRGLRDRAATTKRYGALIAGNIVTMVNDPKDFVPYLPILLPDLKAVLLDPIPDCRSISAKALGSLTRSLGEATFPDLRPWLIDVLRGDQGTSVERSGAAQGLTELLCAGGTGLVHEVMKHEILPMIDHPKACTREGVLWVLTFLPSSLGQSFAPLIDASFPALISGLSDENESVRDVAMRAGRVTIRSHGKAHVDKILPSLEDGLSNEDYRIRAASLNLLGDLLSALAGTKVSKGDIDTQEDIRQAERAQAQIALVLGPDTRKRVLSGLYLRRSDTAAVVRQAAVQVWKAVVSVTPRTLREILDMLVEQIVNALASGHPDHTQVAGRCLGDIVSKLGDTVLPEIMPVLKDALYRGDTHTRLGACVGLTEVIACSSKEQIAKYLDSLVRVVEEALCDDDEEVRTMAASCFQNLYIIVGNKAFDAIVPQLLAAMESGDDESRARAVNGITGILSIRSKELLPYLVTRLVKKRPISANQASALGSICTVTGGSIHVFFGTIVPALLSELSDLFGVDLDEEEKSREEAIRNCIRSMCSSVELIGVNPLIGEIASKCSSDKEGTRKESCWMMQVIVEERKDRADFFEQIPIMFRELLHRLNDDSKKVLVAANSCLSALSKHVPAEELVNHIEFIRNLLASIVSDARRRKGGVGDGEFLLPGFNMPKGLEPMLPIYQRGILYGDAAIREVSAAGLGELMVITSNKFLAGPFIIKVTGPLLRIVGDRNPSAVKIAIIKTLGLILSKGGPALRAFVPQFQTTFFKALSDPARQVRVEAIKALALLMPLSTRVDPLIKELVATSLGNGSAASSVESAAGLVAVQTATLEALAIVIKHGGKKAKLPTSIPSALEAGKEMLYHEDDGVRVGASKVIGASCALLDPTIANEVAAELLSGNISSSEEKHGQASLCLYLLSSVRGSVLSREMIQSIAKVIKTLMMDEHTEVREAACVAIGAVLGAVDESETEKYVTTLQSPILKCLDPKESMDVLKSIARGLCIGVTLKPKLFSSSAVTLPIMDAALKCAMSSPGRVQLAFNDFLWLALNVKDGEDGLNHYCNEAMFDNSKKMKSLHSKVLVRIKSVDIEL